MDDKPIKGVIAIAVDEKGHWIASGCPDDPEGREATNFCLDMMSDDDRTVGMVAIYLKEVEFWPAMRETLDGKPLTKIDIIENVDDAIGLLMEDCEVTLEAKIAKTLDRLKSLVRLHAYVKSEVSYYENDANSSIKAAVQEAIELVGGEQQSAISSPPIVQRSVEHKVEHSRKETVTVRGSVEPDDDGPDDAHVVTVQRSWDDVSDDEIYEALASPLQMYNLMQKLNVPYRVADVVSKTRLSASGRFIQRGAWWWRKEDHDAKYGAARSWDDITDDEIAAFMVKSRKGSELAEYFGASRRGVDARLSICNRFMRSGAWWKLRPVDDEVEICPDPEAEPETNGTTAVQRNTDNTTRAVERPVETSAARLVPVEEPDDPEDYIAANHAVDHLDSPGHTPDSIEKYVRQRLRQSSNGMMLIADIAEELGIGQAAVAEVVRSMSDVSHTGLRVIQKLVK